jgi:L-fucose dehydrogenase
MSLSLKDKVVLVNGRDPALGEAVVRQVLRQGALPCVLQRHTSTGFTIPGELLRPADCFAAVRRVVEQFGRIDAVINDLEYGDGMGWEEAGVSYQECKAALPYLRLCSGAVVNIVSRDGVGHSPEGSVLLTLYWAEQLKIWGIRVNGVMMVGFRDTGKLARMAVRLLSEEGSRGALVEVRRY